MKYKHVVRSRSSELKSHEFITAFLLKELKNEDQALSPSKNATSSPTGTFRFPTTAFGVGGAALACARFSCFLTNRGSTNFPVNGVWGVAAPSQIPRPRPKRSIDLDRIRGRRGGTGEDDAMGP